MKNFDVMTEVTLRYTVNVDAKDESDAQSQVEEKLEQLVVMLRDMPDDYDIEIGDIDEVEA